MTHRFSSRIKCTNRQGRSDIVSTKHLCIAVPIELSTLSFFFSSRRRHTRSLCDWSSDVCSSDLTAVQAGYAGACTAVLPGARIGGIVVGPESLIAAKGRLEGRRINPLGDSLGFEIGRASCRERV